LRSWVKEKDYLLSEQIPHSLSKKISKNESLESSLKVMRFHIKYLNEKFPNILTFAPKQTVFYRQNVFNSQTFREFIN
jgi:hypothetical protein